VLGQFQKGQESIFTFVRQFQDIHPCGGLRSMILRFFTGV
jgi:hypothetical protein